MRGDVHADIRPIFTYPDLASAQARHKEIIAKDTKTADKLTAWMDAKIPQGFTVYALLEAKRRRMRTSNALERVNQELKYRTRVTSQEKLPQHEPL
jgi:putative transposase